MQCVITEYPPCGREYIVVFYDPSSTHKKKIFEWDQMNHCFNFLEVNLRNDSPEVNDSNRCSRDATTKMYIHSKFTKRIIENSTLSTLRAAYMW